MKARRGTGAFNPVVLKFGTMLPSTRGRVTPFVAVPVRPVWLQAWVQAAVPNIQDYTRLHRAGKSRKRGRRASAHWAVDQLRHLRGGWEPRVYLSDIRNGATTYMAGGLLPLQQFSLPQQVALPLLRPLTTLQFEVDNRDMRRMNVGLVLGCYVA